MMKTSLIRYDWLFIMGLQETACIVDPPTIIVTKGNIKLRTTTYLKDGAVYKTLDEIDE